jgi:hypothetical protein
MTDKRADIFGQIDALLGKRGREALSERVAELDDFPMLTEIIHVDDQDALSGVSPVVHQAAGEQAERRTSTRRQSDLVEPELLVHELAALEQRMKDLIDIQQGQLETLVRQIVREELQNK